MTRKSTRKNARKSTRAGSASTSRRSTAGGHDPLVHGVPGVDFTKDTPVTHVNTGDGSDANPHNIVPRHDWQHTRV